MELTKNMVRKIAIDLQAIKDEKEFDRVLDAWWESRIRIQEEMEELYRDYIPNTDEIKMYGGAYLTSYQYAKINESTAFDKDMIELRGRNIKINGKESESINENSLKCIKKILEELKILDLFYIEEKQTLYLEGRIPKINRTDDYEYEYDYEREKNIYITKGIVQDLIYIWFETINENRRRERIDYLGCKKTEYILLCFLPVFDINNGNIFKEYDKYKRDVNRIHDAIEKYEEEGVKTVVDFESQMKILFTPKVADEMIKELAGLNGKTKKLFYSHMIVRMWNSVKDAVGLARIYKIKYMDNYKPQYEELVKDKEMSDIKREMKLKRMYRELENILFYSNIEGIKVINKEEVSGES